MRSNVLRFCYSFRRVCFTFALETGQKCAKCSLESSEHWNMTFETNVSVVEGLPVVIVPKGEWDDFNKELLALRKCLEKNCKLCNNRRKKSAKKRRYRIDVVPVCDSTIWWWDLILVILVLTAFAAGEVLQLDCGSLDKLLYILAAYSQTLMSRPKKSGLWLN